MGAQTEGLIRGHTASRWHSRDSKAGFRVSLLTFHPTACIPSTRPLDPALAGLGELPAGRGDDHEGKCLQGEAGPEPAPLGNQLHRRKANEAV